MQIINQWPASIKLALPGEVKKSLLKHLVKPFAHEKDAKEFWDEYPSTIILLDKVDSLNSLAQFNNNIQILVNFALSHPEYSEPLAAEYTINLSITNDEGTGIYLVINNNSELLKLNGQD